MKAILMGLIILLSFSSEARLWNIGHRADELEHTQNSMKAFMAAAEMGADFVEHDLRLTKDHQVIVHHDPNLNSNEECGAFNGKAIHDLTLEQIKTCRFKKEKTPIPTFDEVVKKLQSSHTGLLIELKDPVQMNVITSLSNLDKNRDCAKANPSALILSQTYQCFKDTILFSFGEDWVQMASVLLKSHPELHNVRILKLVPPDRNQKLLNPEGEHYWSLDGVALELESMGSQLEKMISDFRSRYPHKLILLWSGDGKMDFPRLTKLPVDGLIASDIRGLIEFQKKNSSVKQP